MMPTSAKVKHRVSGLNDEKRIKITDLDYNTKKKE